MLPILKSEALSNISRDVGQVFFASVFLGPMLNTEIINVFLAATGLLLSIMFWYVSLLLSKE